MKEKIHMRKIHRLFFGTLLIILFLCGCSEIDHVENTDEEMIHMGTGVWDYDGQYPVYSCLHYIQGDNGWLYCFLYAYEKGEEQIPGLLRFNFYGFNLRYRYDKKYASWNEIQNKDGSITMEYYERGALDWGFAPENRSDQEYISDHLTMLTKDELLQLTPEDLPFTSLDPVWFLEQVKIVVNMEPHEEGKSMLYWEKPSWAALAEPEFIDGYKFQICFICAAGMVDAVYIDVLYQTGKEYDAYDQLSDQVESGNATKDELRAFQLNQKIATEIAKSESFITEVDDYQNEIIGNIDYSRLYNFLYNIHINEYEGYMSDPVIISR